MQTTLQPFQSFIDTAISYIQNDPEAIGLAVGGSYISGQMDAYSDLDLVLITTRSIAPDVDQMRTYASKFGTLLSSFRGDHVGEPRLLIALYASPLLHVDIKFLTINEFYQRVEDPIVVWDRDGLLTAVIKQSVAQYPAMDFLSFVRSVVLGPMLHLKNGGLPKGVRRLESSVDSADLIRLHETIATPDRISLLGSLRACIRLYLELRDALAPTTLHRNKSAQVAVQDYLTIV